MDSNIKAYDYLSSFSRLDEILAKPATAYEETENLPDRDLLTFDNGYYAYCTALFVDIRDSSKLPDKYTRPVLAKIYRAFISEMVAIFNSHDRTREVNIVGDCVWGVYNSPNKDDVDDVFRLAYTGNSIIQVLNYKLKDAGHRTPLKVGFGIALGRALMIKAGYKGSGINDVVYMGDVVNQAAKLASEAGSGYNRTIYVDSTVQSNLSEDNQKLVSRVGYSSVYSGNVVNTAMDAWYRENCH